MIPHILHQTWKTEEIDQAHWFFRKSPQELKRLHPEWEYKFWDDNALESFVQHDYPKFFTRWQGLDKMIKKVDLARCLILHKHGGVYADMDFVPKKPWDELLQDRELCFYRSRQAQVKGWSYLGNAWMASIPNHPFWIGFVECALGLPDATPVLQHTGPLALGAYMKMLPEPPFHTVFEGDVFDNSKCQDGVGKAEWGEHGRCASWQIRR